MNFRQLSALLILVVVLGGVGLVVYKRSASSWEGAAAKPDQKVLSFPLNDVAKIQIKQAAAEVTLAKKNDVWMVRERADYPADFEQISTVIRKFWELKPLQEVKVGPSQFARLDLDESAQAGKGATRVEFKDKDDKPLASILLGKTYLRKSEGAPSESPGFPAGRYVMAEGRTRRVSLVSETFSEIEPKPEKWVDHAFFRIEKVKSITLTGPSPAMSWTLTRDTENGEWKLADAKPGEQVDGGKTGLFANLLAAPTVMDVLAPDAKPETAGLDKPSIVTFETFDHFTYTLKIGNASGENYPLAVSVNATLARERTPAKDEKPDDKKKLDEQFQANLKQLEEKLAKEKKFEQRVYLIQKRSLEPLFKERSQLLAEKKPQPTPSPSPGSPRPGVTVTTPPVTAPTASTPRANPRKRK